MVKFYQQKRNQFVYEYNQIIIQLYTIHLHCKHWIIHVCKLIQCNIRFDDVQFLKMNSTSIHTEKAKVHVLLGPRKFGGEV